MKEWLNRKNTQNERIPKKEKNSRKEIENERIAK